MEAEAMYHRMQARRQAHPDASLDEIAEAVRREREKLTGRLVAELAAQEKRKETWREEICPTCGERARYKGMRVRQVAHREGISTLERPYYQCSHCKRGFFPWDEALGLGAQGWMPQVVKDALRLGVLNPSYRDAAESFTELTGLSISKSSLQRLVGLEGEKQVAREEAEAKAISAVPKTEEEVVWRTIPEPDSPIMCVSSDGVMIHIRGEGWKEVKIVAISAAETGDKASEENANVAKLGQHSYRAGLWDAKTFTNHHWAEACRRGLEKAKTVACISDGALWFWMMVFVCFPRRIEILDCRHALEYLWMVATTLFDQEEAARGLVCLPKAGPAYSSSDSSSEPSFIPFA